MRPSALKLLFPVVSLVTGCAGGGNGSDPEFGQPPSSSDGGADDAADESNGMLPGEDGGTSNTCPMDLAHASAAFFAALLGQATTCTTSSECEAGQCCYVGTSGSACIME